MLITEHKDIMVEEFQNLLDLDRTDGESLDVYRKALTSRSREDVRSLVPNHEWTRGPEEQVRAARQESGIGSCQEDPSCTWSSYRDGKARGHGTSLLG